MGLKLRRHDELAALMASEVHFSAHFNCTHTVLPKPPWPKLQSQRNLSQPSTPLASLQTRADPSCVCTPTLITSLVLASGYLSPRVRGHLTDVDTGVTMGEALLCHRRGIEQRLFVHRQYYRI